MKEENIFNSGSKKSINYFMQTKNWWGPLIFILIISVIGVGMIGYQTYYDAPPFVGFQNQKGENLILMEHLEQGQEVFHKYALMEYGSFFGDGAQRGPDFTAESLHQIALLIQKYRLKEQESLLGRKLTDLEVKIIADNVKEEIKANGYDPEKETIILTDAQNFALEGLRTYYENKFIDKASDDTFPQKGYISNRADVRNLSDFFFWGEIGRAHV